MHLFLRKADINDADIILQWRNDILTRNSSFSKELIDFDTHRKWFDNKLSDDNCFMYILMDGTERVGQIRIDKIKEVGEISYMIAPHKRGMGYGKKMIELIQGMVPSNIKALTGIVENSNEASKKCFRNNHYSEFSAKDITCYVKVL